MTQVFKPSDRGTFILMEWTDPDTDETYLIEIQRYIYNWRLFMTPKSSPDFWAFAWCYERDSVMILAVTAWDPLTEDEPMGWHKRPTYERVRQAPRRKAGHPIRCEHGVWPTGMNCPREGCKHWKSRKGRE